MRIILYVLLLGMVAGLWGCGQSDEEIMAAYGSARPEADKRLNEWTPEKRVAVPFCEYDRQLKLEEKELFALLNTLHSDSLKTAEVRKLKLEMDGQRFMYAWALRNVKQERMDVDPDFVEYARSLDLNDPALVQDDQGVQVFDMRMRWEQNVAAGAWNDRQLEYLNILQKFVADQDIRNRMTTRFVESYLTMGGNERVKEVFALYGELCDDKAAIERLIPRYDQLTVLAAGSPAPDFEMADPQGKRCRLSDLKGKYVMIDIWATWCGPCKLQIPFFEKQYELFASDSRICFISISLDENKEAWKKMLEQDKPQWKQFVVEGGIKSDMCTRYFISAIPRFLLIDPQGRIVSVDVVRPEDAAFTAYIREHLPA